MSYTFYVFLFFVLKIAPLFFNVVHIFSLFQTLLLRRRSSSLDGGSPRGVGGAEGVVSSLPLSGEDAGFCSRFHLPASEVPFPDWQGGRRCSLIDQDRPLMGSKGGRLFLTCSFICFERSSRGRDPEKLVLPLADIAEIGRVCVVSAHPHTHTPHSHTHTHPHTHTVFHTAKFQFVCMLQAKPFAVLPGNGMAIEIALKTSEKVRSSSVYTNRFRNVCIVYCSTSILYQLPTHHT